MHPTRTLAAVAAVVLVAGACGGGGKAAKAPGPASSSPGSDSPAPSTTSQQGQTTTSGRPPLTTGVQHRQVTAGGQLRSYRLFVPIGLGPSQPVPLVVVLHGAGGSADAMATATRFDRQASDGRFVVAYPQGVDDVWNAGFCCGSAPGRGTDDIAFVSALLDRLEADLPVDHDRVFLAGFSNGAMLSLRFACEHPERVRAVVSVAGAMMVDSCRPDRPVSMMEVHGTDDRIVPYQGGPITGLPARVASSEAEAERWAQIDGCRPAPTTTVAGRVTTRVWDGCRAGTSVRLVSVDGGEHSWLVSPTGSVDVTATVWQFFGGS